MTRASALRGLLLAPLLAALAAPALAQDAQHRAAQPQAAQTGQDAFFNALTALCGKAYEGRMVSDNPADTAFAGRLVVEVRDCTADTVRMPVRAGEDRSRTWVVTRTAAGLTLKHDHRHADGSEDAVSQYGGETAAPGTATRQDFPADAFSRDLFRRLDMAVSIPNVWSLQLEPGRVLAYELNRPGRHFRLEFDLAAPVARPPA